MDIPSCKSHEKELIFVLQGRKSLCQMPDLTWQNVGEQNEDKLFMFLLKESTVFLTEVGQQWSFPFTIFIFLFIFIYWLFSWISQHSIRSTVNSALSWPVPSFGFHLLFIPHHYLKRFFFFPTKAFLGAASGFTFVTLHTAEVVTLTF